MRKITFPKVLTILALGYIIYCSLSEVPNAIAYIGFLLSLVTLWAPSPNSSGKDSDSRSPRW